MKKEIMDGNTAASYVSYAFSELAIIYPITPSSPMAEQADIWQANGRKNLFGKIPKVVQMQSESGVAGALHGALTCGALATTYTCSQGLLLMQPNMFKIAGELLPTVLHVSARALATHALSIFGDHQDVMACRQTGFAMLASASVQEAMDMAVVAHLATLKASVPFLHFFDGFRTSHEMQKIKVLEYDELAQLLDERDIAAFQERALHPDRPMARGTTQNGDIYFQNREAANERYLAIPTIVQTIMDKVAKITKRAYRVFDYYGFKDAERVIVMMGSGVETAMETVDFLNAEGEKVGLIKVRLYRPFDGEAFVRALPPTCQKIAVLDRTKEAGALGEPLYLDVCAALREFGRENITVVGGRYGLGSKEFTPSDCCAVFQNLAQDAPKNHFTVGITDDLTHTSLTVDRRIDTQPKDGVACKFFGLGSDGTVGANKNSIKILGEQTDLYVQGYFCYDSKKSGGTTVSHLRFGNAPIHSAYLVEYADFIACHNPSYLTRFDMLKGLKTGGTVLINCPHKNADALEDFLPAAFKRQLAKAQATLYTIDGAGIANEVGLRGKISTVMQAAFFALHPHLLPYERAIQRLKEEITRKFSKKGHTMVEMNCLAIDKAQAALTKIDYPQAWLSTDRGAPPIALPADKYFRQWMHPILTMNGDSLPTSAFSPDGSVPTGTSKLEKHGMPHLLPMWRKEHCIQCAQCAFVCPHACIRPFLISEESSTPQGFDTLKANGINGMRFRIQVSPHDCMGCGVCANTCPTKEKALVMKKATDLMPTAEENWEFAAHLPPSFTNLPRNTVKGSQFYPPLFEFPYACSGCGETPYLKVLTQLFGERLLIANATGCSSIYGGSAPSCPYTKNAQGQGPAWANSLFEDNAEFGFGMRLAYESQERENQKTPSVWIVGGDGWAYDIGYGGLDHVMASGKNVNVLVLDSEVYSNTGGQASKSTPMGAIARFATLGKRLRKKELGLQMMTYGHAYIAQVSMGANKQQLLTALTEAEAYDGPSLIIAYSPCIAHGMDMGRCMEEERLAVECGYWQLYRFNPALKKAGKNPFLLDSKAPTADFQSFLMGENRFAALKQQRPEDAEVLFAEAEKNCKERFTFYQRLVALYEPQV